MASRALAFLRSGWGLALKCVVSAALVGFFVATIDYEKLGTLLGSVSGWHLIALAGFAVCRNVIGAFRSKVVTAVQAAIGMGVLIRQHFVASFYNTFLPTAIGGDGVRVFLLTRCGLTAVSATIFVLIERLIGFYALILIAASSAFFWPAPALLRWPLLAATLAYTLAVGLIFLGPKLPLKRFRVLRDADDTVHQFRRKPGLLVVILLVSLAYQGVSVYLSFFVATITLPRVDLAPFLTLVPLVWFFTMLPVSLGGVGLRELAFVELLGIVGIGQEKALFVSLGTYFALILSAAIGGLTQVVTRHNRGRVDGDADG